MRVRGQISLLDADPGLADALEPDGLADTLALIQLPVVEVHRGPLDLGRIDGLRGRALGVVVIAGTLTVQATVADRTALRLLGATDWLLFDGPEECSIVVGWEYGALTRSRVAVLDDHLLSAAQRWPRVLGGVFARAAQQAHRAFLQQTVSQLPRVEDRLLALLWMHADRSGQVTPDGVWVDLPLTHEALGRMIGAQRPTVSLGLRKLAETGAVAVEGTGFLLDPASHERLAPAQPAAGTCA